MDDDESANACVTIKHLLDLVKHLCDAGQLRAEDCPFHRFKKNCDPLHS